MRLFKYIFVGGVSYIFYLSLIFILIDIFNLGRNLAVTVSFILASVLHFNANRIYAFGAPTLALRVQFFRYAVTAIFNWSLTLGISFLVVDILHYSLYLGVVSSSMVVILFGFCAAQWWIFRGAE